MSVLSDLFKDIADAIGEKTGDPDKPLSPASFPTEILSIVTGGSSGGGDGKELRFAEGSFGSTASTLGRQTISHGLGEKPDFIFVFPSIAGETLADAQANRFCYAFGFNSRISASVQSAWSGFVSKSTGYTIITSTSANGIDKTTSSERSAGAIYTPNDETFEVGGDTYLFGGNYRWIAVSGIGGTASGGGGMGDYIITCMSDDGQTVLYQKPVMHGDSCGDLIERGLIEKPAKEEDGMEHTFLGWSYSIGGSVVSNVFNNVTEDRTVYAVFKSEAVLAHGVCGDNLTWRIYPSNALSITGTGDMYDYVVATRPWAAYAAKITSVNIAAGITRIGNCAFYNLSAVTGSITVPAGVLSIGESSFGGVKFSSVVLPDGLLTIGDKCFMYSNITTITIPSSVVRIGIQSFAPFTTSISSATFKDTTTWLVTQSADYTGGTTLSSSNLANTSTAATYLKSTYLNYYWYKT